ncbi:J domain-containing protein, partial [Acinetobacter baumannii]
HQNHNPLHTKSQTMATISSFYEVLGISETATRHEIKTAYRKLVRTCHPDVVSMNQKQKSNRDFVKICTAYSTLCDPQKRELRDRVLIKQRGGGGGGYRSNDGVLIRMKNSNSNLRYRGAGMKNWESDQ